MTKQDFIDKYKDYAIDSDAEKNVPQLFTLAQGALESGWGEHTPGGELFGVKADKHLPVDKKVLLTTHEYLSSPNHDMDFPSVISKVQISATKWKYTVKDYFVKFDTPAQAFENHNQFLKTNERYQHCFEHSDNPYEFAEALCKAGYATDPHYYDLLSSIMRSIEPLLEAA